MRCILVSPDAGLKIQAQSLPDFFFGSDFVPDAVIGLLSGKRQGQKQQKDNQ
jgi:hypothetical protein